MYEFMKNLCSRSGMYCYLPLVLMACGGGSSGTDSNSALNQTDTQVGVFLDSPVSNIGYRTESLEGVTNTLGEYEYIEGETVTFFIGELALPVVTAAEVITPLDLAESNDTSNSIVINVIRLLQTLDEDADPDNGISISETAKISATQVDFYLSTSDFESSPDVINLLANSGSTNTSLISQSSAIAHFENMLVEEGKDFVANANITGIWTTELTDDELLAFVFFADGTYVHMEVDEQQPFESTEEVSGMEWGTYSRNSETGELIVTQTFDRNAYSGLTDFIDGESILLAHVSGDVLTIQFDENQNGLIDEDESLDFTRSESRELLGVWTTDLTDDELLGFVFFADGTYVHMEVDEELPLAGEDEISGMEWGTYFLETGTGQLTVTQMFDNNGDSGLTDAANGQHTLYAQVSGDVLTLQFDENNSGSIDEHESLEFQRK